MTNNNTPYLKIIGDVHGHLAKYIGITKTCQYSVQIGDMAFDYRPIKNLNPKHHVWFKGNHDNYDCIDPPTCLGDYGEHVIGGIPFYFIRGAYSIDWHRRIIFDAANGDKSWWREEELSWVDMRACLEDYKKAKPRLVITHDAPEFLAKKIGKPYVLKNHGYDPDTFTTNTQQLLEACWEAHQPEVYIHGHFHTSYHRVVNNTLFIGLDELESLDITKEGQISIGEHERYVK